MMLMISRGTYITFSLLNHENTYTKYLPYRPTICAIHVTSYAKVCSFS